MDVEKAKKLVFDFYDLMVSEPAWLGHAYMIEYVDAIRIYREAYSFIQEFDRSCLDFEDTLSLLEKSEKHELDGVYSTVEFQILSDRMFKELERMVGLVSTELVLTTMCE